MERDDDIRRRSFDDEFDAPPSMPTQAVPLSDEPLLSFGEETGPLPHWSEPPASQVTGSVREIREDSDDLSAWSGFGSAAPVWRDDDAEDEFADRSPSLSDSLAAPLVPLEDEDDFADVTFGAPSAADRHSVPVATIRATTKVSAGATAAARRSESIRDHKAGGAAPVGAVPAGGIGGRNMPMAIGVGVGLLAVFGGLAKFVGPKGLVALVAVILAIAGAEFFDSSRKAGYQPAQLLGVLACGLMPLAAYWRGEAGLPHVISLALAATLITFVFSGGIESNPLPNTSVTMLGIIYVGLMGSFASLILQFPNGIGTLWACVLGVVAYDVGGLLFGSSIGRSPLVAWISPNKTWEGLLLGMLTSFLAVLACNVFGLTPWNAKMIQCVQLALVIAIAAPLGDLAESMLKRSLGVKDFGNLLPGHGGVLDRFDCFLFVLPAAYYVSRVLNVY